MVLARAEIGMLLKNRYISNKDIVKLAGKLNLSPYDYQGENTYSSNEHQNRLELDIQSFCKRPGYSNFHYKVEEGGYTYKDFFSSQTHRLKRVKTLDLLYMGAKVVSFDFDASNSLRLNVCNKAIHRLEKAGALPQKDPQILQTAQQFVLALEYVERLALYRSKLRKDLKAYDNGTQCGRRRARYRGEKVNLSEDPLALITWQKKEIIDDALRIFGTPNIIAEAQIKHCLQVLTSDKNKRILSQRRDSWLVDKAKIVCDNLGLTWLYRALMGCEVTQGIQLVNMFAKQSQELGIQSDSVNAVQGGPRSM